MSSKDNKKMYERGITAAKELLPEIKKMLEEKGIDLQIEK